jgi:hypothetical protein
VRTLRQVWILAAAAACSPASAILPDSGNPAHCIASFQYAAYAFKTAGQPERAAPVVVRAIFEMEKLKAAGTSEAAAREESTNLTRAYASDHEAMIALVRACGEAQDNDPKYRAELPRLIALAPQ